MTRLRRPVPRVPTPATDPTPDRREPHPLLALQRRAGNQAVATVLRVGGWSDAKPGSGNAGESTATDPGSAVAVRRIPLTGIAGAATDRAIAYVPASLPPSGGAIDVLLHLHGHPAGGPGGYLGGASDTDAPEADDIDEYRIGGQLAAAGRPMVAILPQGVGKSDFGAGKSRAFDADAYIRSAFGRLTAIGAWTAKDAPTPGSVVLSGHSGADNPISTMLSTTLGPKNLGALFLFDTMYPGAGFVEKIWTYVEGRLNGELAELAAIRAGSGEQDADAADDGVGPRSASPAAVLEAMLDYVLRSGFRLFNVHGGSTYKPQSEQLNRNINRWFDRSAVRTVVGGPDAPVRQAWRANFEIFRSADRAKGVHMRILRYGDHLKRAVDLLPQRLAVDAAAPLTVSRAPGPKAAPGETKAPEKTPAELIAEATDRVRTALLAAATPFVGTANAADIPGMLTMQLISGAKDPRKRLKADNPMMPLYDALWADSMVTDLTTIDDPTYDPAKAKKKSKKPKKADERRRAILVGLLSALLPSSAPGAPVSTPAKPEDAAAEITTEKSLVSTSVTDLVPGKSWEKVRVAVLVRFGALVDGPRVAIERANTYYDSLVPAKFLNNPGNTVVHPDLQAALKKAEDQLTPLLPKLPAEDAAAIDAVVKKKMWSTVIRPNQNAKHKLSDHSYGWAIDIDSAHNPNIGKGAGLDAVAAVTGTNPRATRTAGQTAEQVRSAASDLRQLSQDYVAAMASDTSLAPVLLRLANEGRTAAKLPVLDSGVAATLVAAVKVAKAADRATALQEAVWPEGKGLPAVVPKKGKKAVKPAPPAELAAAIATLAVVGTAYRTSFGAKGARVAAKSEGSAGSVAAHGFLSLPPALVAALSGSDAGGLIWLGTSNQDYMHFELAKEPALY